MLQVVDFKTATDTGRDNSDSIAPITNGESADQISLRRPTENNRSRTQTLRDIVLENVLRHDYGAYMLYGGGTITPSLGGGGDLIFSLSADLYVVPGATAGGAAGLPYVDSTKSELSVGTPGNNELIFTSVQKAYEGIAGSYVAASDVNKISVEITDTGALSITVVDRHILVTINAGTTTCAEVINLVNTDVAASLLVFTTIDITSSPANPCAVFDATTWGTDYTARFLRGGVPGVAHLITAAGLATFFSTVSNELDIGDTLAIAYDQLVDLTNTGGRLQSTSDNTNINVDTALFNTGRYPAKVPNCIPLCKRVSTDELLFVDGAVIKTGTPGTLWFDSYALTGAELGLLATPLTGWTQIQDGPDHNPPVTIRQALDNTDGRLQELFGDRIITTVGWTGSGKQYTGATGLQSAIDALKDIGGIILVEAGANTYTLTSNLTVTKPIWIRGLGKSSPTISITSGVTLTFSSAAHDSKLEGCSLTSAGGATAMVVMSCQRGSIEHCFVNGQIEITGEDCTVQQCKWQGWNVSVSSGLKVSGDNGHVESCYFTCITADSVALEQNSSYSTFKNITFMLGALGVKCLIRTSGADCVYENIVADGYFAVNTDTVDPVFYFYNATVRGFTVASSALGAYVRDMQLAFFQGCVVYNVDVNMDADHRWAPSHVSNFRACIEFNATDVYDSYFAIQIGTNINSASYTVIGTTSTTSAPTSIRNCYFLFNSTTDHANFNWGHFGVMTGTATGLIITDCFIQLNYDNWAGSCKLLLNVTNTTTIQNNTIKCFGNGPYDGSNPAIINLSGINNSVLDNVIRVDDDTDTEEIIRVDGAYAQIKGNRITRAITHAWPAIHLLGDFGVVSNNIMLEACTGADDILFDTCDSCICIGNICQSVAGSNPNISISYAGCTNMVPANEGLLAADNVVKVTP